MTPNSIPHILTQEQWAAILAYVTAWWPHKLATVAQFVAPTLAEKDPRFGYAEARRQWCEVFDRWLRA